MKNSKRIRQPSFRRILWVAFAKFCTFLIPDAFLNLIGLTTKEYITTLFCDPPKSYDYTDVYDNSSHYSTIHGQVIDWTKYGNKSDMTAEANRYPHLDLSPIFPKFMILKRPSGQAYYDHNSIENCIGGFNRSTQADNWLNYVLSHDPGYRFENDQLVSCPIPGQRNQTGAPCFYSPDDLNEFNQYPKKGAVRYSLSYVYNNCTTLSHNGSGQAYVILDNKVLDVTDYLQGATNIIKVAKGSYSRALALDRMFLPLDLTMMLFINLGADITRMFYNEIPNPDVYKACLNTLFYHGIVEGNTETGCAHINLALWITMGCFLVYFLIKMNLTNLSRLPLVQRFLFQSVSNTTLTSLPYTLLFIPFYSEPSEIIRQTIDSLARTNYPDARKMLFFVCDGIVQSRSDSKANYQCVLDALGYSSSREPESRAYASLGLHRKVNYARVYTGFYESGRNRVPFLMVVKEANRGKRDSMLIALSFLERCHDLAHHRISPLEFELYNQCYNLLSLDPRLFKYMLVTDADTQVQADVVHRFVTRLETDPKMLAVSGHVRPANPEENLVTMLQIFPIYMTYYSGLAYEACLGRLMTLNGGFVMYRLWESDTSKWPKASQEEGRCQETSLTIVSGVSSLSSSSSVHNKASDHRATTAPVSVQAVCLHPTVLRGFGGPRPDTLHMESILLLGEEQYLGLVLLRSHPNRRFGFEPEAVAYATLPTHFLALQALQSRNLRAALHTQIEFQHVAKHLGIIYWILSMTKLMDMILSMPIIVYLYNVFIRYFITHDLAYAIIAGSFAGLMVLYVFYFILRRQFKYILWFLLYCIFGVPIFHIYFPLLAVWCSDYSYRWYDVWPTKLEGYHGRLHGILTDRGEEPEPVVDRLRWVDFEQLEAQRNAEREKEEAERLDAKFNGFTGYVSVPASIRQRSSGSIQSNPFASPLDNENPFDDAHSVVSSHLSVVYQDQDACSHHSLSNSILSLEPYYEEQEEGRSAPVHSKIAYHHS
ncbi:hypothetical protein G6F46_007432 [Rhizopus delemar]|uniref:chitin synthase n=2 Tax=Rhizopus TaxID=4842 RepID=A0A9P6Z3R4_9FUNG|nr:hypothetical protein G6F55_008710 [Rhizopus delemar]KAG1541890.1 hypothetical protein G6F51_007613 [Rhizopus arrhizus]KAG1499739.1 hypothetical protein G6F54_004200 [Rhizopus delemar]KAG1510387.1 hypothetical protein G6F53_006726 [Rhizopus delemar]KAG1521826.1 hypothetical protein G6F52_006394 [Rhizopus delemar]